MLRGLAVVCLIALSSVSLGAQDQPAMALKTCVADNTSGKDRKTLAKWVFLAMATHPEMRQSTVGTTASALDDTSRAMAALVTRLLTESCANEARAVIKSGSTEAFRVAFAGLGELAMQELMTDPSVNESMTLFQRYLDQQKLRDLAR